VKIKQVFSLLLVLLVCVSNFSMSAMAVGVDPQVEAVAVRATGRFNMDVPGGTIVKANSSFPLEAGETVTIKASYTPFSASVDFGLIASDGYFYYINVTNGSFDETIKVDKRGNYTFAVMNNASKTISVSGYVNY
jgi:hypothetical protein